MRQRVDPRLLLEIEHWKLRFTCPDCVHYMGAEGGAEGGRMGTKTGCAHLWPNAEHDHVPDAASIGKELVFCKEFDLG